MRNSYDPFDWEYSNHPLRSIIKMRCIRLGEALMTTPSMFKVDQCKDTKLAHKYVFRQFTPINCPFYAGNYRGSNCNYLRDYKVMLDGEPKVGMAPSLVKKEMEAFDKQFIRAADRFEKQFLDGRIDPGVLLVELVEVMGIFLVRFFTTHPFANGNGHIGRLLFLTMLGRVNIRPANWLIDDRPPYDAAIFAFRRGSPHELSAVLMKCIIG